MKNIDIVIATYNGEKYLTEQLESILASDSFNDLVNKVIISDDNSGDGTYQILSNYAEKYSFIEIFRNNNKNGVVGNFQNALEKSKAKFVVLCDQDDIWLTNKLEVLYKGIISLNNDEPCLYFTDLKLANSNSDVISESYFNTIKKDPDVYFSRNSILLNNIVPGCSMIINDRLLSVALPIHDRKYIHDWWFLSVAFFFGCIGYSKTPTIKYRQHDSNTLGVKITNRFEKIIEIIKESSKSEYLYTLCRDLNERSIAHDLRKNIFLSEICDYKKRATMKQCKLLLENKVLYTSDSRINALFYNLRFYLNVLFKRVE